VPVDDTHCYWYAIFTSFTDAVDKAQMREQRLELYELPDYTSRRNKRNNYGYSIEEQATKTYTGMGIDINVHDQWAVESQGPIRDRTREHLGSTDKAIAIYRRMLVDAIDRTRAGNDDIPLRPDAARAATLEGPPAIDGVGSSDNVDGYAIEADRKRREASPWASKRLTA
jgi:hypothetical protein